MSAPEDSLLSDSLTLSKSKNCLQEYVQKASLPLPVYQTISEGAPHAPQFRARVWVDGICFESPNAFPSKKPAEQDAAKYALIGLREKVKNEGPSRILEDTIFCKSIINEYALKMNMKPPIYTTSDSKAFIPMYVSTLELNGVTYVGQTGKNKKEAEQLAARSAILSILDSESSTTMSEIVKSKFRFYDELKKIKGSSRVQGSTTTEVKPAEDLNGSCNVLGGNVVPGATTPLQNSGAHLSVNQGNEAHVEANTVTGPGPGPAEVEIPQSTSLAPSVSFPVIQNVLPELTVEQSPNSQATRGPLHVFKKPKLQDSPTAIAPPALSTPIVPSIEFVSPSSEQAPVSSTSGKKRKRKNKKAKKNGHNQSPLAVETFPQISAPEAVAQ